MKKSKREKGDKSKTTNMKRRSFMSTATIGSAGILLSSCGSKEKLAPSSHQNYPIVGHGDFKYRVRKDWGVQDVNKIPVKDCHEMVEDSKGRLLMITNHVKNNMIIYDRSGTVTDTWTHSWIGAHGLTIHDEGGEEVLYITDPDLHEVYKTTVDGKILRTYKVPVESGLYDGKEDQYKPTETTIAPNGDLYIADGYGLNYILRYDHNGNYLGHFGGSGDGDEQFDCCHGVTLDERGSSPELLITSRSNNRFKRFTLDGEHIETILTPGSFICRPVIQGENLYFAVLATETWWSYDGMVAVFDKDNKLVSLPGGAMPEYADGVIKAPKYDGQTFLNPHDVCIDRDENIYVTQWYSGKTYPVMLERV